MLRNMIMKMMNKAVMLVDMEEEENGRGEGPPHV